jgi:carboxypeptidase family protein
MSSRRILLFAYVLCCAIIATSIGLNAQSIFGTITGTVEDQSGAVVPGANVTLKDVSSGTVRRAVTNNDGYYSFSSVPTGSYSITVEAKGFQNAVTEGVRVTGASSQTFMSKLQVRTETSTVEIVGTADQIVPVDSGDKSVTLEAKQLQDFSEVSRNAAEFIKIIPGFVPSNGLQSGANYNGEVIGINGNGDGGSQSPLNGAYVANGVGTSNTGANGSTQNIDITADGAHVSDPGCNCATPVNPNGDMIQEFKVLTSNFSAENSHGPIVINTVAKSGGHDFHGEGYMYARHYALNANRWINGATNPVTPKPANKFFFPGGNIGGPVVLPHSNFNKNRDKMFFWTGFEYYYQNLDTGLLADTVPTAGMRSGDFSPTELAKLGITDSSGGAPLALSNCLTGIGNNNLVPATCHDSSNNPNQYWGGLVTTVPGQAAPFPGGIIPSNFISPVGLGLTNLFPMPTNPDLSTGSGSNYVKQIVFNQNMIQSMSRVDYNISDNTKLYVRYNLQKETQQFPVGLWWRNANQVPYPTPILGKNRSDSVSASLTHMFSPTMSNEFVFGYTYIDFPNVFSDKSKVSKSALNIPFNGVFNNGIDQIPSLTSWSGGAAEFPTLLNPSGFQEGGSQGLFAVKKMPTFSDVLSKVWGTHTMKFGFYYEFVINDQPSNNYGNGVFAEANWAGGSSGSPFADLLGGFAGQYQESNKDVLHNEAYNTVEFFAQDSWKLTHRLTVDYGLRFSHFGNWYDREGTGFAVWNPALYDASLGANSGTGFQWHALNHGIPLSGFKDRRMLFAPRFGMAYDVFGTGKTILRGGWGQFFFHNAQFTQGLDTPLGVQTPTLNSVNIAQIESTLGTLGPPPFAATGLLPGDDKTPLTTSYSFTVSQRIPFSSLLEVSYVGNTSDYLLNGTGIGTNVNIVPAGTLLGLTDSQGNPINPNMGTGEYAYAPYNIYQALNIGQHNLKSNYNSMQVSWVRQKGAFDIDVNYVYSKALGIVGIGNQIYQGHANYGAQPFDRRHVFNAAYSINLPSPIRGHKAMEGIINGWQLSGITSLQSGVNLTGQSNGQKGDFNTSGNINGGVQTTTGWNVTAQSINGTDQIPLMPIVTCDPRSGLKPHQYVNPNCFALPLTPGTNGPLILPEIFGPWYWNSDLSLFKNFQMGESRKLQFRIEAFNFMNHPEYSFANGGIGSSALNLNWGPDGNGGATMTNVAGPLCRSGQASLGNCGFGYAPIKVGNRIISLAVKYYF